MSREYNLETYKKAYKVESDDELLDKQWSIQNKLVIDQYYNLKTILDYHGINFETLIKALLNSKQKVDFTEKHLGAYIHCIQEFLTTDKRIKGVENDINRTNILLMDSDTNDN